MGDLFAEVTPAVESEKLADGAFLFRRFAAESAASLVELIWQSAQVSPFRHLVTPGGYRMSVAMTNCGLAGWTSDRQGYRYAKIDPETSAAWPPMPVQFQRLAATAAERAGFPGFRPECCLINRYEPGAKLSFAPGPRREALRIPHRISISRAAGKVPFWRFGANGAPETISARKRRCRRMGRTIEVSVPWS